METLTEEAVNRLPWRTWANRGDERVDAPPCNRGCDPSPDAIGGYYGMSWTEVFKDQQSGELYRVECSDGVNGGKGAYEDEE